MLFAYMCFCLSKPKKSCVYFNSQKIKVFGLSAPIYRQKQTGSRYIGHWVQSTVIQCLLGMDTIKKLFHAAPILLGRLALE